MRYLASPVVSVVPAALGAPVSVVEDVVPDEALSVVALSASAPAGKRQSASASPTTAIKASAGR